MPKPWEKYQQSAAAPAAKKPWERYQQPEATDPTPTMPAPEGEESAWERAQRIVSGTSIPEAIESRASDTKIPLGPISGVSKALEGPELAISPKQVMQTAEGLGRGFADAATLGHGAEIEGKLRELLLGQSPEAAEQQAYAIERASEEAAPVASTIGQATGMAGTMTAAGPSAVGRLGLKGADMAVRAAKVGEAAAKGAGTGFAYSPGEGGGLEDRIEQAKTGAMLGGALGAAKLPGHTAARRSRMIKQHKKGQLSENLREQTKRAEKKVYSKVVRPATQKARQELKGKTVSVNTERMKGISPGLDKYLQKAEKRGVSAEGRVNIPADRAHRLKRLLRRRSEPKHSDALKPEMSFKREQAGKSYKRLDDKLDAISPAAKAADDKAARAIEHVKTLKRFKNRPIEAYAASKLGRTSEEVLRNIDEMAGTTLSKTSSDVSAAMSNLFPRGTEHFMHPLELPKSIYKLGRRGAGGLARGIEAVPEGPAAVGLTEVLAERGQKKNERRK